MTLSNQLQQLYQHPDNPLLIQNHCCYLQGIEPQPTFLWEIQPREAAAKENIQKALSQEDTLLHFFIGIEHLSMLHTAWPAHRKAIIIEKSACYAAQYLQGRLPSYANNITIIILENGFFYPYQAPIFMTHNFIHQFCLDLAMQLFYNETQWSHYQIWHIALASPEQTYAKYLRFIIRLVHAAKQIHQHLAERYQTLKNSPSNPTTGVYLLLDEQEYACCEHFNYLFRHMQHELIVLKNRNRNSPFIDDNPSLNFFDENDDAVFFEKRLKLYLDTLVEILTKLEHIKPKHVVMRCLVHYTRIEDLLLLAPMFKACGISQLLFFTDPYQQYSDTHLGGPAYFYYFKYFSTIKDKLYHCDVVPAKIYTPAPHASRHFTLQYFKNNIAVHSPCTQAQLCNDILIIHNTRTFYPNNTIIKTFFEILVPYSLNAVDLSRFLLAYLYLLRNYLKLNAVAHTIENQMILNMLDMNFYNFYRIHLVKLIVDQLKSNYRIKVIGAGWEHFLNQELCLGEISHFDLANHVQHSGITVNTFPNWSKSQHHHAVYEYYRMGGLVLENKPAYTLSAQDLSITHPLLHGNNSIYYTDLHELQTKVAFYLKDFDKRNEHILNVQNDLSQLKEYLTHTQIEDLENHIIPTSKSQDTQLSYLTGNPILDEQLMAVGLGFIHYLRGYHYQAEALWKHQLDKGFPSEILKKFMDESVIK